MTRDKKRYTITSDQATVKIVANTKANAYQKAMTRLLDKVDNVPDEFNRLRVTKVEVQKLKWEEA
jgi:flavin reductase (DIM6/NTAB) family NADH-FMN oxidoreductase RutF